MGQGLEARTKELAEKYADVNGVVTVGNGQNYVTALEMALKFKEAVLLAGEGLETEEAFHGPIASLNPRFLVSATSMAGTELSEGKGLLRGSVHDRVQSVERIARALRPARSTSWQYPWMALARCSATPSWYIPST